MVSVNLSQNFQGGLYIALAIGLTSCFEDCGKKDGVTSGFTGNYTCRFTKTNRPVKKEFSLSACMVEGRFYPYLSVKVDGDKMNSSIVNSTSFKFWNTNSVGTFNADALLVNDKGLNVTADQITGPDGITDGAQYHDEISCTRTGGCGEPVSQSAKRTRTFTRSVFIRPCQQQLYLSFVDVKNPSTTVGGGTVSTVCADLRDSGVTDIFIPFKADDELSAPACGSQGVQLYPSGIKLPQFKGLSITEPYGFKKAWETEFDPIKYVITTCTSEYDKTSQKIRFHAWFPVFADRKAASIAPVVGISGLIDKKENPGCKSKKYANPANGDVRRYELDILEEITKKYPIAGINLDYIRYPDLEDLRKETGCSNISINVNSGVIEAFVREVKARFPSMTLSADVKSSALDRLDVGQGNIIQYLDVVMPMLYTGWITPAAIPVFLGEMRLLYPDAVVVPDLRGWDYPKGSGHLIADLTRDISLAKEGGSDGYAIFTYEQMLKDTKSKNLKSIKGRLGY